MLLNLHAPDTSYFVKTISRDAIQIADQVFKQTLIVAPDQIITWPDFPGLDLLDAPHAQTLLALKPEVVLLGTGNRQRFPAQSFIAAFLTQGIGLESMVNAAAARTFNVLAEERRKVVAAFLFEE